MRNDADIARIGYVLENYDSAALLKDENGNPILSTEWQNKDQSKAQMVKFAKKIDGTYYVVEAVPDSGKKTLRVVSAYLQKDSGSSTRLLNMGETPSQLTPKTPAGMATSAVDSIPQLMQTVNTGDEPAAYGDNAEPRFDSNVQDDAAKEQRSAQEQPTVHSLLMETDSSKVKNAIERKYLKEYRQTANLQLAEQQKLDKLQAELDALPKDNRQTSRARYLRDEIIKTKNRLQICQSILTRLETNSPLTYLIHREIKPRLAETPKKAIAEKTKYDIMKAEFESSDLLTRHYEKHREEFGDITEVEYLEKANQLFHEALSEDVEQVTRSDGSFSKYKFSTNEFLVITKDGKIRTYFKPVDGAEYWRYEHERN